MSLKFCPKCGNKLEPDSQFCDTCGADLRTRKDVSEAAPTVKTEVPQTVEKITPSGVVYGDFWPRLLAIIIDGIIIGIISWVISYLIFLPYRTYHPFRIGELWFTFPFDWLIGFLYFWLMESYNNGQTLGKSALNLRTVDEKTFEPTDLGKNAVNNLLKPSVKSFLCCNPVSNGSLEPTVVRIITLGLNLPLDNSFNISK